MIIDAAANSDCDQFKPDVLVVGSGPIGLLLSRALSDRGLRVLIIEAGPRIGSKETLSGHSTLQDGETLDSIEEARTRQVGGGLNLWGGQLGLLEPFDFERGRLWPVTRQEAYSHLKEALTITGLQAHCVAQSLERSFSREPVRASEGEQMRIHNLKLVETAWLPRPKLNRTFWRWIESSESCLLCFNAVCVGIVVEQACVAGVVLVAGGNRKLSLKSRCIALAAGTIENARLLMLPSLAQTSQPWHGNPWLGRGFNEHLDAAVGRVTTWDRKQLSQVFDQYLRNGIKYTPKITWEDRSVTVTPLGACGTLSYSLSPAQLARDAGLLLGNLFRQPSVASVANLPVAVWSSARQMMPIAARYISQRRIGRVAQAQIEFRVSVEQPARFDSFIRLSRNERDSVGMPKSVLRWQRGDEELVAFAEFASATNRWLQECGIGSITIDASLAARSQDFWAKVNAGLHHAGTTKMSESAASGVVDRDLKVHGVQGLYVCGASVFPASGYINPTLTGMALAVRLAEHISNETKRLK